MLAGEAAPITQLPCEKPKLALTVGRTSDEVRAVVGRAGHVCQGCPRSVPGLAWGDMHRVASGSAGNTPPASTAVPMEGAEHPLFFFTKHFEIQLQNTILVRTPMLQITPTTAGCPEAASALPKCREDGRGRVGPGALGTNHQPGQPAATLLLDITHSL